MILDTEPTPEQRRELLAVQVQAQRASEQVETTCRTKADRITSAQALLLKMGKRRGLSALHIAGRLYLEHGDDARTYLDDQVAAGWRRRVLGDSSATPEQVHRHLARAGVPSKPAPAGTVVDRGRKKAERAERTELAQLVFDALARNRERMAGPRRLVEVAQMLGCDVGTVQKVIRGERKLAQGGTGRVTGERLAGVLGVEASALMAAANAWQTSGRRLSYA